MISIDSFSVPATLGFVEAATTLAFFSLADEPGLVETGLVETGAVHRLFGRGGCRTACTSRTVCKHRGSKTEILRPCIRANSHSVSVTYSSWSPAFICPSI